MELNFKIKDDKLISGGIMDINTGNLNVYKCNFEIPEKENFVWICVFKQADEAYQQVIENGKCYIPSEVMNKPGTIKVGCYGIDGEKRISTNWLEFNIAEGAYCQATAPEEPSNDLWEILVLNACPYIGENGNWYVYDKADKVYKDSGKTSKGDIGEKGDTGYTPQRGIDYWTDADKNAVSEDLEKKLNFEERLREITKNTGDALKGKASGNLVTIRDISAVEHFVNVKVTSKNLIDINTPIKLTSAKTQVEDNKLHITRTNTYPSFSNVFFEVGKYSDFIGETLTLSLKNESEDLWIVHILGVDDKSNGITGSEIFSKSVAGNSQFVQTFKVPERYNSSKLALRIQSKDNSVSDGRTFVLSDIQLEKGNAATDYERCRKGEDIILKRYGGNILDIKNPQKLVNCSVSHTDRDVVITRNAGVGYANVYYSLGAISQFAGKTMTISAKNKGLVPWIFYIGGLKEDNSWVSVSDNQNYGKNFVAGAKSTITFKAPEIEDAKMLGVRICSATGEIATQEESILGDIQVSFGNSATEYAAYFEAEEYSLAENDTLVTISTPSEMTFMAENSGIVIECEYNRDINSAVLELEEKFTNAIISLGGNV